MADDKKQPIEIKDDGVHSDVDFMAAIDQQMDAIDEKAAEHKEKAKQPTEEVKTEPPKVEPKEEGKKIAVGTTTKPAPKVTAAKPTVEEVSEVEDSATMKHSGKTLQPISVKVSEDTDAGPEATKTPKAVKPAKEPTAPISDMTQTADKTPAVDSGVPLTQLEAKEGQIKSMQPISAQQADKTALDTSEPKLGPGEDGEEKPQTLKTFDTTKYNLPIKPTKHHRKHAVHPVTVVALFIFLALFISVVAVDMELLDVGIELPFDLL